MNQINLSHITSLPPREVVECFIVPAKIESWFAYKSASCVERPIKRGIEITVLQDHYLEWIFPNQLTFALLNEVTVPSKFSFHQIDFELDGPILSKIDVLIEFCKEGSTINVSICGNFGEEFKQEILKDWGSLSNLSPVKTLSD